MQGVRESTRVEYAIPPAVLEYLIAPQWRSSGPLVKALNRSPYARLKKHEGFPSKPMHEASFPSS